MPGSSLGRHLESGVDPGNEVGCLIDKVSVLAPKQVVSCDVRLFSVLLFME